MAEKTGGAGAGASGGARERIRADLERLGVDPAFCESIVERLAALRAELGPGGYDGLLAGVATAYGIHRQGQESLRESLRELLEIQRLMDATAGEIKKLDEALRTLATYVGKMRRPPARRRRHAVH